MNGERVCNRIDLDFELSPGTLFLGADNAHGSSRAEFDCVRVWPSTNIRHVLMESGLVKGATARIDLKGIGGTNKVLTDDGSNVLIPSDFLSDGTPVVVLAVEPERIKVRWVDKGSTVEGWVDRKIVVAENVRQP